MAIPNRPGKGSTRLGQPAVNVPAKRAPAPAPRPATGPVAKQNPPAARNQKSGPPTRTGRAEGRAGSGRVPTQAAKSNTPMIIGIVAGVVVILGIGAFVMGGDSEKHATIAPKEASKPKAVDVSGLEKEGLSKCDQGLTLIQKHQALLGSQSISDSQKSMLKGDLEKGRKLIADGMALLTQANEKSKNTYDTKQYQEALITVRKKLMELRD